MEIKPFIIAIGDLPYKNMAMEILDDFFSSKNIEPFFLEDGGDLNYKNAHPSWLKLISHQYIDCDDDIILCWDLDLLPKSRDVDLPPVFDGQFGLSIDTSIALGYHGFNQNFKFNCGLIAIPANKRKFCEEIYDRNSLGQYPSYEQYYFNDALVANNENVGLIPIEYNTLYHTGYLMNKAYNIHYTWQCIEPHMREHQRTMLIKKHYNEYFSNKR